MKFQERKITTASSQYCDVCAKIHKTGATVLMGFEKPSRNAPVETTIVCDEFCLQKLNAPTRSLDKFLDRVGARIN